MKALKEAQDEELADVDDSHICKEFIFLIDRSGSMYDTIKLERKDLVLFLYSLPPNSRFNICSYGGRFEYMFSNERSVEYTDQNLNYAVHIVESMEADFGGTKIFEPLQQLY